MERTYSKPDQRKVAWAEIWRPDSSSIIGFGNYQKVFWAPQRKFERELIKINNWDIEVRLLSRVTFLLASLISSQKTFIYSKSPIETLKKDTKHVQN